MGIPSPKETLTADNLDQMRKMIVSGNGGFLDIDLSEDASTLAVATTIGVDLYDFQTFEPIGWLASQNPVYDLDFSPDGKLLAVAEMESASIWDWHTQTLIHRLSPQEGDLIKNVAFSPSGQLIWGGSGSTQVWKAADGSQVLFVKGVPAEAASISVDDTILAAPTVNSVRLLNLADGSLQQELRAYGVHQAQFLPDGDTLLAIANDLVHGFSLQRGELTPSIGGQVPVVSWDGETLVSDNGEGKIQTWRLSGNSVPGFPFRQFDQIGYSLVDNHEPNYQISQNGEYLAYWNNWRGNFIFQDLLEEGRSWNGALSASSSLRTYNYGFYDLRGFYPQTKLLFSPLDPESIVTFWQNSIIESWDFTTEQEHRELQWVKDNTASRLPFTINQYIMPDASQSVTSPDKTLIAKADAGKVLVTLANDSSVLHTIYANVIPKTDLVFSPDSSTLATISSGPTIRIWNMTNGRQICVINGDGADPDIADAKRLFFSDDHQKLAVYHARDQVSYWNASNCQRLDTYQVKDAAISPDGTFFIEPQIYQLNLRKLNDGSLIRSLYGLFDENTSRLTLGFSKDGNFFGAIYTDGTAHLWGIIP
jgi:WD40 repeat protein